jgi:DNA-binding NtrC family response regulator
VQSARILIADDEDGIRFLLRELLTKEGYQVEESKDGEEAVAKVRQNDFDLAILDIKMPKLDGIEVLKQVKKSNPNLIVLMITAHGTQRIAINAIREGAYDYFSKPFDVDELRIVIRRGLEKRRLLDQLHNLQDALSQEYQFDRIIGGSSEMQEVYCLIRKVITNDVTVLIQGESGTGKELVAQAIHYHSYRKNNPFVKINCVAIPETLLESEMFGHEKGSFTGALTQKIGKFEQAEGGTLFLDEIGDMPLSLQAKLLRVLQEREFERVGGTKTVKIDIRIIASTNKDLLKAVEEKTFREDLYFRINVLPIYLPPLRQRTDDIPLLIDHFINYYNAKLQKNIQGLSKEVMDMLMRYGWPGNIREMENMIQRAMILSPSNIISADSIPSGLKSLSEFGDDHDLMEDFSIPLTKKLQTIEDRIEKRLILAALAKASYKRQESADLLGISRKSLHNKMLKYNLFE